MLSYFYTFIHDWRLLLFCTSRLSSKDRPGRKIRRAGPFWRIVVLKSSNPRQQFQRRHLSRTYSIRSVINSNSFTYRFEGKPNRSIYPKL